MKNGRADVRRARPHQKSIIRTHARTRTHTKGLQMTSEFLFRKAEKADFEKKSVETAESFNI